MLKNIADTFRSLAPALQIGILLFVIACGIWAYSRSTPEQVTVQAGRPTITRPAITRPTITRPKPATQDFIDEPSDSIARPMTMEEIREQADRLYGKE